MKRQRVAVIAGLIITIAVIGCGNSDTSVEPTESVIETEIKEALATEEIEETETEEEHQLFDPDEIGSRGDKFWFEDEATIAYIMNIPGVSDLSDEELDAFMSELAELIYIDEFNGDVGQTESYIVSDLLPKYLEKQTVSSDLSSQKKTQEQQAPISEQSASTPETSDNNEQAVDEYDDDNVRLDTPPSYDDGQVGPMDYIFGQDEGADWGEYDSNASSANWQY